MTCDKGFKKMVKCDMEIYLKETHKGKIPNFKNSKSIFKGLNSQGCDIRLSFISLHFFSKKVVPLFLVGLQIL